MTPQKPRLLALDDDAQIAEAICQIAGRAGFQAASLTTSDHLLPRLFETSPDIIVLDLQMPGADGISVLRSLADSSVGARVMLVSGMDERTLSAAEQYGLRRGLKMAGAVQKPFDPEELFGKLERVHAALRPLTVTDLQHAIDNDELTLYYQPIVKRFADNTWDVCAVEALLRWNHPIRGLVGPDSFVEMGEVHGMSRVMADFVLQRGIEQIKGWLSQRLRIGLRVNIAATLIADVHFPDRLERMLIEQELDAGVLSLELTETAMLEQSPQTFDILTRLRIKDISLAIDDFGIGYSSLTQLFRMPFNEMKIDRSIAGRISESKEAAIMVDALVGLAHKLGLEVCAEGVEDALTLRMLENFGCDFVQGYYVSAPVPAAEIPAVIARWEAGQRRTTSADRHNARRV